MSETQDTIEGSELIPLSSLPLQIEEKASIARNIIAPLSLYFQGQNFFNPTSLKTALLSLEENDVIKGIFSAKKSFADLDYKYRIEVYEKIKNSGLLNLVEQVGGIREFARKRFSNVEFLRRISR